MSRTAGPQNKLRRRISVLLWKILHVVSMVGVITLWVGAWVVWDLVARTGDRRALRRVDLISQTTGQIGFALLLIGLVTGFVTAITGGFDLTAPWLLIAYALVLFDLVILRWATVHVARVRAAQDDANADLTVIASSPRANATLVVLVTFWVLLIVDMILKPFA
jgi:hypothetical protein